MTQLITTQHNFNGGAIEPRMYSRVNTDAYAKGAAVLDNVVQLPQGGVTRRGGLEYIDELVDEARLVPFAFSTTQTYLLAFYVDSGVEKMKVYKDGALVHTHTITSVTYTQAQILEINWTQSADTLFIVHEDVAPISIVRASDTSWTDTALTLTNVPQYDFNDASSPTPTDEIQDITFTGYAAGKTYFLSLEGIVSERITWNSDTTANAARIEEAVRDISVAFPPGDVTVAYVSAGRYTITFTGGATKPWEPIELNDTDAVTISLAHNTGSEQTGVARSEDVWSATRGYPNSVTFHEGRFWFGGSKSRPQSLWGTAVNSFSQTEVDFDEGIGLDADGISVTLDTDQVNKIVSVVSGRHLQVLTVGGEFAILKSPITPENISVTRQSKFGSSSVRPAAIDGATLFIQRTGKALREYLFSDIEQAYTATSLSLLSSHLLVTPVDSDARIGTTDDDANYVYIVNTDGSVAVFNTLRDQEVAGWTRFTTDGVFKRVGVDDQTTYFLVKRTINSVTKYYLEKLNDTCYTDCCTIYGTQAAAVTGLSRIEGKTVRVKADGAVLESEVVTSGAITMDRAAVSSAEIGLNFDPTITLLPINQETAAGSIQARKIRVVRHALHVYETLGLHVDGIRLPDRAFGVEKLGEVPDPFTGIVEHRSLGWTRLPQPVYTQEDPLPMTILGLELTIKVNH